eukprot:COSAG02_NODE_420_length_22610_cov_22.488694_9_plen_137_part_00
MPHPCPEPEPEPEPCPEPCPEPEPEPCPEPEPQPDVYRSASLVGSSQASTEVVCEVDSDEAARCVADLVIFGIFAHFRPNRFSASHGRFAAHPERTPAQITAKRRGDCPSIQTGRWCKFGRDLGRGLASTPSHHAV